MKVKWLDVKKVSRFSSFASDSILHIFDKEISLRVFIDTGNNCTEPLSNEPVHFVSLKAVQSDVPIEFMEHLTRIGDSMDGIPDLSSFPDPYQKQVRLIRIQTVDGGSWAIGIRYDNWILEGNNVLDTGYIVLTSDDARYPQQASAILHVSALETSVEERGMLHAT